MKIAQVVKKVKGISLFDRCLLTQLLYLSRHTGYCYAGNQYFCESFDVSLNTVKRSLRKLESMGLIMRMRGSSTKRYIHVTIDDNAKIPQSPENEAIQETVDQPIDSDHQNTENTEEVPMMSEEEAFDRLRGVLAKLAGGAGPRKAPPPPPPKDPEDTGKKNSWKPNSKYGYRLMQKMKDLEKMPPPSVQKNEQKSDVYYTPQDVPLSPDEAAKADVVVEDIFSRWHKKISGE